MPVTFEEEQNYKPRNFNANNQGFMVKWLMDKKIAPTETVANIILLVIAAICIIITIWLMKPASTSTNNNTEVPETPPMRSGFQQLPPEIQ